MSDHPSGREAAEAGGLLLAGVLVAAAVIVAVLARRATPEWFGPRWGRRPGGPHPALRSR